jgi:hypothetical protein
VLSIRHWNCPHGLKPASFAFLSGTAEQAAEKLVGAQKAHLGC